MEEKDTKEHVEIVTKTSKEKVPSADGGYGWVVVVACFFVHMLLIGYLRSFGLLFVKFLTEFKAPVSYTSTVMGIQSAVFSLTSLIVLSVLIEHWSIRGYAMIGAVISATGVSISAFAMNVEFLIFSQSILIGIGNGFTYGPGVVLIGRYFKKRLALANAIANAGVSAGAVVMPITVSFLLEEYGLRGALLIIGAIMLQVLVCVTLYRNPGKSCVAENMKVNVEEFKSLEAFYNLQENKSDGMMVDSNLVLHEPDIINGSARCTDPELKQHLFRERTLSNISHHSDIVKPIKKLIGIQDGSKSEAYLRVQSIDGTNTPNSRHISESHHAVGDVVSSLSRSTMLMYASNPNLVYASLVDIKHISDHNKEITSNHSLQSPKITAISQLKNIFDINLFKNPIFWIIAGFTPLCMCGSAIGASFLPALAEEKGMDGNQASLLLTVSGALDVLSRLIPGIIVNFKLIKQQHMICISFLILGIIFQFTKYFDTFALLMLFASLYGVFGGVYFALLAVIIIDMTGFEKFPKVFGFVQVFHGASAAICYPVLGGLRDITGTYDTCFQFLGACMIAGSIILSLEPLARRRYNAQEKIKMNTVNIGYSQVPVSEKLSTDTPCV